MTEQEGPVNKRQVAVYSTRVGLRIRCAEHAGAAALQLARDAGVAIRALLAGGHCLRLEVADSVAGRIDLDSEGHAVLGAAIIDIRWDACMQEHLSKVEQHVHTLGCMHAGAFQQL